ncbi:uncharacterized protein LOC133204093 [Saccostrea echinata]|uniref:uncharacterized protein LOC133204093 n=1 Tax=Saccostrea echinata TaxID=191078 RepID=UPI002A82B5D3|nr:uncharacterized protein LOC133204093 [Saccostrea echinata]
MKRKWISLVCFLLVIHWNVYGQNATCSKESNALESCDRSTVLGNNILIDFGEINYQCTCSISLNFSGQVFYTLAANPGYADCGTAIRIIDKWNQEFRIPCSISPGALVVLNSSSTVELVKVDPNGPTGYCLRVLTNDISNIITASCGSLESTSTESNLRKETYIVPRQSTNEGGSTHATRYGNQTTGSLINTEFISYSPTAKDICGGNGQLIGFVICAVLVFILSGIIITLVIYIVRYQKRKSTLKNDKNRTQVPESLVTQTSPGNCPTSTYTTLHHVEANDLVEQPYTGLNIVISPEVNQGAFSARPNSAYTSLNPEQDKSNTEKLYTDLTIENVYYESN